MRALFQLLAPYTAGSTDESAPDMAFGGGSRYWRRGLEAGSSYIALIRSRGARAWPVWGGTYGGARTGHGVWVAGNCYWRCCSESGVPYTAQRWVRRDRDIAHEAPAGSTVGRTYGGACADYGVWKASNCYRRCSLEAGAPYTAHLRFWGASARPGEIELLRPKRPQKPLCGGRTEEPAPTMAFGRKVIATGDVDWKRVLRIPPIFGLGALAL